MRRVQPYLVYGEFDFDVPVGEHSDNFDRYLVRLEEVRQSRRMIAQCFEKIPAGPVDSDDPRVRWPRKGRVFGRMEELIDQFKLVTEGGLVPPGEVYHAVEGANGELGFLYRQRRHRQAVQVPLPRAELLQHVGAGEDDHRRDAGRRGADLRHDQHDRRRVRPLGRRRRDNRLSMKYDGLVG